MRKAVFLWVLAGALGFVAQRQSAHAAADDPPPLEPPTVAPPIPPRPGGASVDADPQPSPTTIHEALAPAPAGGAPVHVDKAPPARIVDRPGMQSPGAGARWIDGYWEWDRDLKDFVWVTGVWKVLPPGQFWVNGVWKRDGQGWYRVPGFLSKRKSDVRRDGPPVDRPEDRPGPAPGPDYFFLEGQYVPSGDGVSWRPGFWARIQPGWSWVPARWVHLAEGWAFRDGRWERSGTGADPSRPGVGETSALTPRDSAARLTPGPFSPIEPAGDRSPDPSTTTDLQPLPQGGVPNPPEPGLDPSAGATPRTVPAPNPYPNPNPYTYPNPTPVYPGVPPNLPITEINIPGIFNLRVVPGQMPSITTYPIYPRVFIPQVQIRP
jgi:hypothetical protein